MISTERLKLLRKQKGVFQKNVAEYIGVKTASFQRFELGIDKPKLENLIKIADYYNVSLDYLVGRSDNPNRL